MLRTVRDADLWALIKDAKRYKIIPYVDEKYYQSFEKLLWNLDIEPYYFVADDAKMKLRSVYEILTENADEIMVIVVKDNFPEAKKTLEGLGLSMNNDFKDIQKVSFGASSGVYNYDPVCGYNLDIPKEAYPGFKSHGIISEKGTVRIMTLGGSTTDDFFPYFASWPEILHLELEALGVSNIVFNGGVTGYSSGEELFKLIRDGVCMDPDIVITYSGVNDSVKGANPYINDYMRQICAFLEGSSKQLGSRRKTNAFGITWGNDCMEKYKNPAYFWLNNQKMMHSICECFGIRHFVFHQPNMVNGKAQLSDYEKEYLLNTCFIGPEKYLLDDIAKQCKDFRNIIREETSQLEWVYDASDIFDDADVYIDYAHVKENGNQIIAREILRQCQNEIIRIAKEKEQSHSYEKISHK